MVYRRGGANRTSTGLCIVFFVVHFQQHSSKCLSIFVSGLDFLPPVRSGTSSVVRSSERGGVVGRSGNRYGDRWATRLCGLALADGTASRFRQYTIAVPPGSFVCQASVALVSMCGGFSGSGFVRLVASASLLLRSCWNRRALSVATGWRVAHLEGGWCRVHARGATGKEASRLRARRLLR